MKNRIFFQQTYQIKTVNALNKGYFFLTDMSKIFKFLDTKVLYT